MKQWFIGTAVRVHKYLVKYVQQGLETQKVYLEEVKLSCVELLFSTAV